MDRLCALTEAGRNILSYIVFNMHNSIKYYFTYFYKFYLFYKLINLRPNLIAQLSYQDKIIIFNNTIANTIILVTTGREIITLIA